MKRRDFVKASTMAAFLPKTALSNNILQSDSSFPDSIMKGDLNASSGQMDIIMGTLPENVYGHVFVAEGIPLEKNHLTPGGKGALTRVDFKPDSVHFVRKMIETPSAIVQKF
ncbi:hypothetical protein KCG35_22420, partial [Zooshikella sp. WH53]|nr:hypothetical protein [Zooshikella harenae]